MLYIVGAGPGAVDLLTVRGAKLLGQADVVVYAGSLVNPALLDLTKPGCQCHDSAALSLEQTVEIIAGACAAGQSVVRLHSGDPSLFGAIREQIDRYRALDIAVEVVPGVSSCNAAAAALQAEYTLPGISQSLIITRLAGRTPVPEEESLAALAAHQASMAIFLSVQMIEQVVSELRQSYPEETPVAVVYRASWPDQQILLGTLVDIAEQVRAAGIDRSALILVGRFLGDQYELSCLYHPDFSHGYRRARSAAAAEGVRE